MHVDNTVYKPFWEDDLQIKKAWGEHLVCVNGLAAISWNSRKHLVEKTPGKGEHLVKENTWWGKYLVDKTLGWENTC